MSTTTYKCLFSLTTANFMTKKTTKRPRPRLKRSRPRARLWKRVSRRLETKPQVSRTTSSTTVQKSLTL